MKKSKKIPNTPKYKFGGSEKTIFTPDDKKKIKKFGKQAGTTAYGVGEGLLDTVTMGATDQLTDQGYYALQKAGNSTQDEMREQDSIRGFSNAAGAIGGAIINPAATGTAISQTGKGLGAGISKGNESKDWAQGAGMVLNTAGQIGAMAYGQAGSPMTSGMQTQAGDFNASSFGQGLGKYNQYMNQGNMNGQMGGMLNSFIGGGSGEMGAGFMGNLPSGTPPLAMKYGGQMKYAMGGMNIQPNAEIESEENVVAPNGGFLQADGPTHEQGGVPVALPGNSMVFSDRLKLGKKTFAELNKVNNTNREDKLLKDSTLGKTSALSLHLTKMAKNKNSEALFNAQEALKQAKVEAYAKKMGVVLPQAQEAPEEGMQYAMGGVKLPMYPLGGGTDNTKFTPAQIYQAEIDSGILYKSGFDKNVPNWQKEPEFKNAFSRLTKLNGKIPQSTDKRQITYNTEYLKKHSVPYAKPVASKVNYKPVAPKVNYKKENNSFKQPYSMDRIPLQELKAPEPIINPQLQQVPANSPNTIKTNIVTAPNYSYKEYKQGNEVLDRMYFDPKTQKEINVGTFDEFKYGGMKLPKFTYGAEFDETIPNPEHSNIINPLTMQKNYMLRKNMDNMAFNQMVGNTDPRFSNYDSDYQNALNKTRNEVNAANRISQETPEEEVQLANDVIDKQHGWNHNDPLTKPKPTTLDPNNKNFDWGKLAKIGQNYGNFALQNAGNIYDLTRKQDPLQKYDRAKASLITPDFRDANQKYLWAKKALANVSGGNAGTALANIQQAHVNNVMNRAQIQQAADNTNAGILNQNSQFNTEIAYREAEAQAKDRAMRQNVNSQAVHSMASNFGKFSKSGKQDNIDQDTLAMFQWRYQNEPEFKALIDKFSNSKGSIS